MTRRRLPIGIQTFRELRERGCYYVDAPAAKADLAHFATEEELRAELASLEARLAWRLIGAGIAIAGISGRGAVRPPAPGRVRMMDDAP